MRLKWVGYTKYDWSPLLVLDLQRHLPLPLGKVPPGLRLFVKFK